MKTIENVIASLKGGTKGKQIKADMLQLFLCRCNHTNTTKPVWPIAPPSGFNQQFKIFPSLFKPFLELDQYIEYKAEVACAHLSSALHDVLGLADGAVTKMYIVCMGERELV